MKWSLVEPLESESLIDEFEQLCGYKFPESFRECVIKNNGGRPEKRVFDIETEEELLLNTLLSFNKKIECLTIWETLEACKIHLSDAKMNEDIEWIKECETILERYVLFADTPFGDKIAFDKTDDSVVYICHDGVAGFEKIADSFEEFLDCLYEDEDDDI